jgi:hypothetical protein
VAKYYYVPRFKFLQQALIDPSKLIFMMVITETGFNEFKGGVPLNMEILFVPKQ